MFTPSSLSVSHGPAVHPTLDAGGSELRAWYGLSPLSEFVSPASFDGTTSSQLDAQDPGNRHVVLRSTRTPGEWQSWLDAAPAGASFEASFTVKFQMDTQIQAADAFDPFTLIWEVQSTDPGQRTFVDSSTTSLGRYLQGRITGRLWNLPASDFDISPDVRRRQLEDLLNNVTAEAEIRGFQAAMSRLDADVLSRMNGFFGGDPSDDWVVSQEGQNAVYPHAQEYLKKLKTMTVMPIP